MVKNSKEIMDKNFNESVPSAMKHCLTNNKPFEFVEDGKTYYIGMLLDTAKIGGITKKSQNDKEVGGMIECVRGGKIDLFVTAELNERGELLFLPTPQTINCLSEYGKFRECKDYEFVKLNGNLDIVERTGFFASYDIFRAIGAGQLDIQEYLAPAEQPVIPETPVEYSLDDLMNDDEGTPDLPVELSDNTADELSETPAEKTSVADKAKAVAEKVGKAVQNVAEKVADNTGYSDMVEKPADTSPQTKAAAVTQQAAADNAPPEEEKEITYTEIQVEAAISRIFHADNLDLPVSSEPFDQLFTLNNQIIAFDFDERDTYVNEHLNIMAADANRDLQKLRSDNLRALREKYFMLMSVRVLDIQKELDINNQDTEYGSQKWALENTKRDKMERIRTTVDERRKALEDIYNRNREDHCNAAAQRAKTEWNALHQRAHNDAMDKVEGIVKHEIQTDYEHDLQELYTARRNEALSLLDLNITGVLKELSNEYRTMFEAEKALYNKHAEAMREYANELHAEDAKRLAIDEERNRISTEVSNARADAAAKIDLIKREYETAQTALEARSQVAISQAESQTQLLKEQMAERTGMLEKDKEKLQEQLDEAIERAATMQNAVKVDYEHRLAQAKDDRDSWKQTFESYKEQHRHNNRLATVVVVAVTLAALVGGFMAGGLYWNKLVTNDSSDNSKIIEISEPVDDEEPETSKPATSKPTNSNNGQISTVVNIGAAGAVLVI